MNKMRTWINIVSIAVPVVVAILLGMPNKLQVGEWTKTLPHVIGAVNTVTSLSLIAGLIFIKKGRIDAHRLMMLLSILLGAVFLVCYVVYHLTNEPQRFAGIGPMRAVYLFILISHVGLSLAVLPLVLRAAGFAFVSEFERHKKIVRYAYPTWLYVSVTGVLVYLLGYHFNPIK